MTLKTLCRESPFKYFETFVSYVGVLMFLGSSQLVRHHPDSPNQWAEKIRVMWGRRREVDKPSIAHLSSS